MKKRELGTTADGNGRGLLETLRAKRQRVNSEQHFVGSISDRLATWLLPASTPRAATKADARPYSTVFAGEPAEGPSGQFFPFTKHRQSASDVRRARRTGRSHSAAEAKTPSTALQAIEKWLFTTEKGHKS